MCLFSLRRALVIIGDICSTFDVAFKIYLSSLLGGTCWMVNYRHHALQFPSDSYLDTSKKQHNFLLIQSF
jgi:hypothetical protein